MNTNTIQSPNNIQKAALIMQLPFCTLFQLTVSQYPHTSHSITQEVSDSSTQHAAPHYALSCSQLFPNTPTHPIQTPSNIQS